MYPETLKLVTDVVETFKIAKVFSENSDRINSIDFSLDGKTLISSSDDDSIVIYDCEKGVPKRTLHSKKYGADLIRFAHNEDSAVHSSTKIDDTIRYLSLHDNKYIRYFTGHVKKVASLSMSPVDDSLLSASLDKTVRLWDLKSPNCQGLIATTGKPVACFDPEGLSFAIADNLEGIKLYDIRSFDKGPFSTFFTPKDKKDSDWMSIKYSPNGKTLLLCSSGSDIHLLDAYQGTLIQTFSERSNSKGIPLEVSFSPDSQFIFTGSTEGTIYVWNADSGMRTAILQTGRTSPIHCVQFNPKYMLLVSTTSKMAFWLPVYNEL
ncbi:WD repeat-containing protein 82 [Parasteatoda tepidariorum]|uniref:WD repeat-containing protein 82 n=1 Tax=Parasteatoda tepidariorum TaxID=114398 RepID=UPI000A2C08D7|nr:WD repeat-containing protein 82 [Parasteatoda tepidariorum]